MTIVVGLALMVPMMALTSLHASTFLAIEFLLAFVWFIAEAADVPVLILLLLRWARRDRAEAADFDALTDAEHDALVQAHLRGARAGSDAAR